MNESMASFHHDFEKMWLEDPRFHNPLSFSQKLGFDNREGGDPVELKSVETFGKGMLQILREMWVERGQLNWIDSCLKESWACPTFVENLFALVEPDPAIGRAKRHLETMSYVVLACAYEVFLRTPQFASSGQLSQEDVRSIRDEVFGQVERTKTNKNHLSAEHVPCLGLFHDLCTYFTTGKYPDADGNPVRTVIGLVSLDGHEDGGVVCDLSIERFPRPQNWGALPAAYPHPDEAFRVVHADFQQSIKDALGYVTKPATRTDAGTEPFRCDFRYKLTQRSSGSIVQSLPYLRGESAGAAFALCFSQLLSKS